MSVDNHKRHRGNDEPDAPLLMEVEDGACREVDVVIRREQGDQANHDAGEHLDPALEIETAAASRRGLDVRQVWRRFESRIGFGRGIGLRQGPAASSRQHGTSVLSRWARNAETTAIKTVRPRQVLPLEVREPGFDRCEPRVLFLQLLGLFLQQTRSLLDVVDGSPVEHRQQAPAGTN